MILCMRKKRNIMKSMERCEGMQQSVRGGQKKILIMLCPVFLYRAFSFVLKENAGIKISDEILKDFL